MKMRLALAAVPVALIGLSACSTYDYGYGGYGYNDYGYQDYGPSYGYGGGAGYGGGGVIWSDAYYDDFYGPVYGGYWDNSGYFWYQLALNGGYQRDHNRHFRRDRFNGYKHYRLGDHRNNGRDNNWDRDRDRDRDRNNSHPPLFSGQKNDRNNNWNDRNNNNNGNRYNPPPSNTRDNNRDRNNANNPSLFQGQQPPRVNPSTPRRGDDRQLDGAPRGGDRDGRDRRGDGRGRGQGATNDRPSATPPPQAAPAPAPPQPRQQQQSRSDDRKDRDRGSRGGNRYNPPKQNDDDGGNDRGRGRNRPN